ncbi:phospholipase D-like domain-containing protein [Cupriavidus basilensis]
MAVRGPLVNQIALTAERLWWQLSLRGEMRTVGLARRGGRVPADHRPAAAAPGPRRRHARRAALARQPAQPPRHRASVPAGAGRRAAGGSSSPMRSFLPGQQDAPRLAGLPQARRARCGCCCRAWSSIACSTMRRHALYATLLGAGVEIHEYAGSFLHAKVAVIDDAWATVGSSNLDPFSLLRWRARPTWWSPTARFAPNCARNWSLPLPRAVVEVKAATACAALGACAA